MSSSNIIKGFILAGGIFATGVILMKFITPSEGEMRERLGYAKGEAPSEVREKNKQIMAALKREAGLSTDDKKS